MSATQVLMSTSGPAGSQKSGMSLASQGASSTHLASSVFQGVRAKLTQLKAEVSEKGRLIGTLQNDLKLSEARQMDQAAAAVARQQVPLSLYSHFDSLSAFSSQQDGWMRPGRPPGMYHKRINND